MYYLTITAKRKGAKRHIKFKNCDIDSLELMAQVLNHRMYVVEIYNGKWELIKEV